MGTLYCEISDQIMRNAAELFLMGAKVPIFQLGAVCLTKFGPESGETAEQILARKEMERRSGSPPHLNEFWWGIGEKGTAESIRILVTQHGAQHVLFTAIKNQQAKGNPPADVLVWCKYRMLSSSGTYDVPEHVMLTSARLTRAGQPRAVHYALVCKSAVPIQKGGSVFQLSNRHYKNLSKDGALGKTARGQRTTTALVKWTNTQILATECDAIIDFVGDLCAPYCVELLSPKQVPFTLITALNRQIASGLTSFQWLQTVKQIRH